MRWEDREESSNVDDRRGSKGSSSGGMRGMPSMGTLMFLWPVVQRLLKTKFGWAIIGIGAVAYFSGFNPLSMMTGENTSSTVNQEADDRQKRFISTVLADTENVWGPIFKQHGAKYQEPKMVLYRGSTTSGCGHASAQMGPFYCPADQKIYIDLGFFDELASKHNASGDFAQAYVLAHEVGHHIQNMEGTLSKVQQMKQQARGSKDVNQLQVRVELQADCYAGVWAHHAHKRFNILEQGDVEEALRAASAIGDDTLQKQAQGYVVPDAFTHGSAEQRVTWFRKGIKSGDIATCNTGL
ncbi:MAG: YpfJ protein, zinc metalloprotease superfamily [uncultured Sulfurovum sp.]|uniref:YpfJ protein, zinc metalloprotease superfamily n=1 Tax=uncultured Sulfurovum sp. TaxID=269237 RepID=A0A6S6SLI9_9BACT|nr:MAG: YpfJ protein, zinc metalloprotease superfamily [uncultured Sulfurovum sp.]